MIIHELHCGSACVLGSACELPLSKDMRVRLIDDSKFTSGVNVNGSLTLYISPVMEW